MIKNLVRTFSLTLILSSTQGSSAETLSGLHQSKIDAAPILGKWQCEYADSKTKIWHEDEYRSDGVYFSRASGQTKAHLRPIHLN